jgi:MraZ protein
MSLALTPGGRNLDRFLSHFVHRFDAKGRISIPAPFRAVLMKDGFEGLFTSPALEAPAQDCGGKALLMEIDALLDSLPPYSGARDAFATALLGAAEILKMDAEGRVVIDERTKARLGLDGEAVFVGQGHKFQIWRPENFEAHLANSRARLRLLHAELGARGQARAQP